MVAFFPPSQDEDEKAMTRVIDAVHDHYDRTFRPPHGVKVGIRVWAALCRYIAQHTRFRPVREASHEDYFCAYCDAVLPLRRPAARCSNCGAPWTSREDKAQVSEHKRFLGPETMSIQTSVGSVDVSPALELPGDAIEVS